MLVALAAAACGKEGPPLPPLRPVPAAVTELTARLSGATVALRFQAPAGNLEGPGPVTLDRIEIYARSVPLLGVQPRTEQIARKENLVATIEIRPPVTPGDPAAVGAPPAPVPASAPADSRPAPGDAILWSEAIPPGPAAPYEYTRDQAVRAVARAQPRFRPLPLTGIMVPALEVDVPMRYYVVVGVTRRGRPGAFAPVLAVPLVTAPAAAGRPAISHDETTITVTWPVTIPPTPVNLYASAADGTTPGGIPLHVSPVLTGTWSAPVEFNVARCFVVRAVKKIGPVSIESEASAPACATPVDRFPPPAPTRLLAVASEGVVTLVWTGVEAADLAGYLVLRSEGGSDTLQPLMTSPIAGTTYLDKAVRAGVRYDYQVVAVDKATPPNSSARSNRETAIGR